MTNNEKIYSVNEVNGLVAEVPTAYLELFPNLFETTADADCIDCVVDLSTVEEKAEEKAPTTTSKGTKK